MGIAIWVPCALPIMGLIDPMIPPLPPSSQVDNRKIIDNIVREPHDIDDVCAGGEQYEQASDDSATPCSRGFRFASEDERAGDA